MAATPPSPPAASAPQRTGTRTLLLLAAATVLLRLPGLGTGLFSDDLVQHWTLEHGRYGPHLRPWALFDFGTALGFEQADAQLGGVPWWTAPDWKVRFLRPVASLWIWGEHALFPGELGHALVGPALIVLLVLLVHRLARSLGLGRGAAVVAALWIACEESTHLPVAWTANRNTLVEAVFGVLAILAARRASSGPWRASLAATALALLATGAKESGLAVLALVALALPSADAAGRLARHAPRLLPLIAAVAYLGVWIATDHGARSLFYPVPWERPGLALERGAWLLGGGTLSLLSPASLDLLAFHPGSLPARSSLAVGLLALGAAATLLGLRALERRRPPRAGADSAPREPNRAGGPSPADRRLLGAWFLATVGVQAAAPPSDRLLLLPAVPLAIALASLATRRPPSGPRRARAWRFARGLLLVSALPASAAGLVLRQVSLATAADEARALHVALATAPGEHEHRLLLQLPNALAGLGLGPGVRLAGGDPDGSPWPLRFGRGGLELFRTGPRTLELRALDGPFLSNPIERVFGSFAFVPHGPGDGRPGTRHDFGPGRIEVLDGPPRAASVDRLPPFRTVRLTLAPHLEPRAVGLYAWSEAGPVEIPWPAPGERAHLPAARSRAVLAP